MSKKKKKRKAQSKISRILASSNKGYEVREKYFSNLDAKEIKRNFSHILKHRHFRQAVTLSEKSDYSYFYSKLTPSSTLSKNLYWSLGLILNNIEKVEKYIEFESLITKELLNGNYEKVLDNLNNLDSACGISTWSMSLRCSVFSMNERHDNHKHFLEEINSRSIDNSFFQAVVQKVCSRYEESSLFSANIHSLKTQIKRYLKGEILHFLMYKLIPTDFSFNYDYEHIFNVEKNSSIVDLFVCLLEFVCYSRTEENEQYSKYAKSVISALNCTFNYSPIQGLANSYGIETDWKFVDKEYELLDIYTAGDYQYIQSFFQENKDECIKFSVFEILTKSYARTEGSFPNGLQQNILENLINVYLKNEHYNDSVSYLFSLCHCFSSLSWFKELSFLLIKETKFLSASSHKNISMLSSSYSAMNSPIKIETFPDDLREKYSSKCEASIKNSLAVELFKMKKSIGEGASNKEIYQKVENNRLLKYKSIALMHNGKINDAITILQELSNSTDIITAFEATRLLADAYIRQESFEQALDLYVKKSIENNNLILNFDTDNICSIAEEMVNDSSSISIPIALSLHSRYVNSQYDSVLKYSFEIFLNKNGVKTPLELIQYKDNFNENQLLYFLEYVCIPEVMKLYLFFDGTVDIENCRIDVCKYLIENSPSKDRLVDEIKERTRMLVIRDAVKQVESSKIYADTGSLRSSRAKSSKQLFEKYQTICTKDFSGLDDEVTLNKLYNVLKISDNLQNSYMVHIPNLSLNEKNTTFLNLLKSLRDEFTFGDKGLNSHLSTRIRHGHFPTTLRKCVSDERLVTSKLVKSKTYKSNVFWLSNLEHLQEDKLKKIDKAFSKLSTSFDELITEVNDSWLQIWTMDQDITKLSRGETINNALFNYSVSELESYSIQKKISIDSDYDDLLKIVIPWLWEKTEKNLSNIREKISHDVRQRAYQIIDDLQKEIIKIVTDQKLVSELFNALGRARSALSLNLEQIISWFTRSEGSIVDKFEFDTAIEIAKKAVNANVDYTQKNKYHFDGKSLSFFVDILYILFENAISKSNLPKEELKVKASLAEEKEGNICLLVTNNIQEIPSVEEANEEIDFYRESYGKDKIINHNVQGEGGTGFFKIWKILSKDLEIDHKINFGFVENEIFSVVITILNPEKVIYNENINS